jgi:uncharacterized RDD family membrane protein YckC
MRAAELQIDRLDFPEDHSAGEAGEPEPRAALKEQVAERLAAHRSRRSKRGGANLIPIAEPNSKAANHPRQQPGATPVEQTARTPAKASSRPRARIANAVAERYAQTQSYRDFLAAEAARAIEEANAAAEVAARNAEAVTVAQQRLLAELDLWSQPQAEDSSFEEHPLEHAAADHSRNGFTNAAEDTPPRQASAQAPAQSLSGTAQTPETTIQHPVEGLTVRLYEDAGIRAPQPAATQVFHAAPHTAAHSDDDDEENFLLDDEIAFRQTPVFPEPAGPPTPIPANLIEFPRQLVAPRKARPRIAEGPLREEADAAPASAQLRIFEVDADQIATAPIPGAETVVPEWSSIHLDAAPVTGPAAPASAEDHRNPLSQQDLQALLPLQTASLNRRAMAAAVDACLLGLAFLAAVAVAGSSVNVLPAWPIAAGAAGAALLVLLIFYHLLFFTFSESTPGMRYARIGLCTFSDENPTRAEMRRRTWAVLLSACPLGIGFLWALLDDDRLGWHDRISRMYQRSY